MFDTLSDKLQSVFQKLRGHQRVSAQDFDAAMREVRLALLEADVNFQVVKDFVARVREHAVGANVLDTLTSGQQVIKIVHDALVELLGGETAELTFAATPPTVIMLCGLQGSGKTTLAGKLALELARQKHRPMLAACDIYRPAAVRQLQVLGGQVDVPVHAAPEGSGKSPPTIAREAIAEAAATGCDVVILDTAGRLHIDDDLMDELGQMKAWVKPHEVLLVVDAMVGQDAVTFAEQFQQRVGLTGFVMTKMDGDSRGGAALSIRQVTGVPIKFMGTGEKLDALEPFHPDRLASRILGMGDILSLIEKAQEAVDEKQALELERKLRTSTFNLDDFLDQMQQMKKMGPVENLLKLLPGVNASMLDEIQIDPKLLPRKEAIVRAMTPAERHNPRLLDASRRRRIAAGCGLAVHDVNQFMNEFDRMGKLMRKMMSERPGAAPLPARPAGSLRKMPKGGKGSGFRLPFGR